MLYKVPLSASAHSLLYTVYLRSITLSYDIFCVWLLCWSEFLKFRELFIHLSTSVNDCCLRNSISVE